MPKTDRETAMHLTPTKSTRRSSRSAKFDVFLSYHHDDTRELALFIYTSLIKDGYRVFLDTEFNGPGYISSMIDDALMASLALVVVVGRKFEDRLAKEDDWVRREVDRALANGLPIVPVAASGLRLEKMVLPSALVQFSRLRYIAFDAAYSMESVARLKSTIPLLGLRPRVPLLLAILASSLWIVLAAVFGVRETQWRDKVEGLVSRMRSLTTDLDVARQTIRGYQTRTECEAPKPWELGSTGTERMQCASGWVLIGVRDNIGSDSYTVGPHLVPERGGWGRSVYPMKGEMMRVVKERVVIVSGFSANGCRDVTRSPREYTDADRASYDAGALDIGAVVKVRDVDVMPSRAESEVWVWALVSRE